MNNQPIEKKINRLDGIVDVHSIFFTIQGEGPFAGFPAVFIRLAGCNLQCPGCDTEYTSPRTLMQAQDIAKTVYNKFNYRGGNSRRLVVITGGEPFRQNITLLLKHLLRNNFFVQIETNGTLVPPVYDIQFERDITKRLGVYVVCSPKSGQVRNEFYDIACAFKYVLSHDSISASDGLPIKVLNHTVKERVARPSVDPKVPVYIQPMDHSEMPLVPGHTLPISENNKLSLEACKNSCQKFGYILQVQLHKIIGVE